jgi:hypothetical protein
MGFLYADGHVRAYHGQRTISSVYVARCHLAMPATTDYWANDRAGDPLLVITGDINAALATAFPNLLREVRAVIGERRATIVFDRGGWSPKLFQTMIKDGFDILTYRKGKGRLINEQRFVRRRAKLDGRWVSYDLHDQPVRFLKGKLRLRQVSRLCDNGHQTQVITNRWDLRDIEVAYRMFERWRQENFFKYMRDEFLLDALVDYRIEPEDPTRTIPNPERRNVPRRVEIRDLSERAVVKLATERKHLTDIIKMVAYQIESDLLAVLRPHYARVEQEGRTLLHELFAAAGDIQVSDSELRITLAPLSSPHRTRAAQALCEILDKTATTFPGSRLRIRFAVRPPPCIGLAFPGTPAYRSTVPATASAP